MNHRISITVSVALIAPGGVTVKLNFRKHSEGLVKIVSVISTVATYNGVLMDVILVCMPSEGTVAG